VVKTYDAVPSSGTAYGVETNLVYANSSIRTGSP
jgi:hypothetical protein